MERIGCIGVGNMGGAIASVLVKSAGPDALWVSSRTMDKAEAVAAKLGAHASTNRDIAASAQVIFLGVKPQLMAGMLADIAPILASRKDRFLLVSMAGGHTAEHIMEMSGGQYPVLRIMPNTPSGVGAGMIPYCGNALATAEDMALLERLLAPAGRVEPLGEHLIEAASSVSGCGPAFMCVFLEAMADAGVACGLPRKSALEYAAQTMLGTAKLVLESGMHPAALKDQVCSPGGSTIRGVHALEKYGLRAAVEEAVLAAFARNNELGK